VSNFSFSFLSIIRFLVSLTVTSSGFPYCYLIMMPILKRDSRSPFTVNDLMMAPEGKYFDHHCSFSLAAPM
jgi:hypothetical protein